MNTTSPVARTSWSLVDKAAFAIQSTVCVFTLLFSMMMLTDLQKTTIPGAPVAYLYACIAVSVVLVFVHLPWVFFRLPRLMQFGAYVALLPALAMFGDYSAAMKAAYFRTPEGAKEAAVEARNKREAAASAARVAAMQKASDQAAAQEEADHKTAEHDGQKPELCDVTAKQVVDGDKIMEINNVAVETSTEPNEVLTCSGDAITSRGNVKIEFGLVQTPRGKTLVSTRFP